MVAGEKNSLLQLWCPRDRATFDIPFVMESGMPKLSFSLILIKRLLHIWALIWNNYYIQHFFLPFFFFSKIVCLAAYHAAECQQDSNQCTWCILESLLIKDVLPNRVIDPGTLQEAWVHASTWDQWEQQFIYIRMQDDAERTENGGLMTCGVEIPCL